jgi:hypothetical protein
MIQSLTSQVRVHPRLAPVRAPLAPGGVADNLVVVAHPCDKGTARITLWKRHLFLFHSDICSQLLPPINAHAT